jgi:hypothetical protein
MLAVAINSAVENLALTALCVGTAYALYVLVLNVYLYVACMLVCLCGVAVQVLWWMVLQLVVGAASALSWPGPKIWFWLDATWQLQSLHVNLRLCMTRTQLFCCA